MISPAEQIDRGTLARSITWARTVGTRPAPPTGCRTPSRLKWNDLGGDEQSKLLVTAPETVIAEILQAKIEAPAPAKRPARRPARGRNVSRGSKRLAASVP
jgi:hypothetical protein